MQLDPVARQARTMTRAEVIQKAIEKRITWQQAAEETIAHHFQTGINLCEAYLVSREAKDAQDIACVAELHESFRAGLGLDEEDEIQVEFRRDTPKGGD